MQPLHFLPTGEMRSPTTSSPRPPYFPKTSKNTATTKAQIRSRSIAQLKTLSPSEQDAIAVIAFSKIRIDNVNMP
jgi:hypothetical protein